MTCRLCQKEDETLHHIVNCGADEVVDISVVFDGGDEDMNNQSLKLVTVAKIINFLDKVK